VKKQTDHAAEYVDGVLRGDIATLSRAITLVESRRPEHRQLAREIMERIAGHGGQSFRLGVTGVPGAGKSTFIERYGMHLLERGNRLAVLAVDPSSSISKGSILGDKTRMAALSGSGKAFIRPSPSGGALGGVTAATYETILLCEAAGFDYIIVETVGVGQSEIAVSRVSDFFLLLMLAGAGDELQGIKRGIMELADAVAITKADGDNLVKARAARSEYAHALHLLQAPESGWTPKVLTCSATEDKGIREVMDMIDDYRAKMTANGYLQRHRQDQQMAILKEALDTEILQRTYARHDLDRKLSRLRESGIANPYQSLSDLLGDLGD
jgi:LAO/AO transport system kinase